MSIEVMQMAELSEQLYEDLNGQIVSVATSNLGILIALECDDWSISSVRRRFLVNCREVKECTVTVGSVNYIKVMNDHITLLKHNSEHSELFFSSAPASPHEVIGRLLEAHSKFYGQWRPLSEHLITTAPTLSGGHGMIARGPTEIMEIYAAAIRDLLKWNIVRSYTPKKKFMALVFDGQFVVCDGVDILEI